MAAEKGAIRAVGVVGVVAVVADAVVARGGRGVRGPETPEIRAEAPGLAPGAIPGAVEPGAAADSAGLLSRISPYFYGNTPIFRPRPREILIAVPHRWHYSRLNSSAASGKLRRSHDVGDGARGSGFTVGY
jgi:hypothetical protein